MSSIGIVSLLSQDWKAKATKTGANSLLLQITKTKAIKLDKAPKAPKIWKAPKIYKNATANEEHKGTQNINDP